MEKIAVGNRFFETRVEKTAEAQKKIKQFVQNCLSVPEIATVLVAVNTDKDVSGAMGVLAEVDRYKAISVTPWGKFVPPLNALVAEAAITEHTHILFISTEVVLTSEIIFILQQHMTPDTLVVGARVGGHNFKIGVSECDGVTTPWNTCALYDLGKLSRLGFPMSGEALFDLSRKNAGVEEVSTIALYQSVYSDCVAKLVEVPGLKWETAKLEGDRLVAHQKKMESKASRPAAQLDFAGLKKGKVEHILMK